MKTERTTSRRARPILAALLTAWLAGCGGGQPALLRRMEKLNLVDGIQRQLFAAVDAEKNAVLATTDEESRRFADQSKRAAAEVDRLAARLGQLIAEDRRPDEVQKLAAFTESWGRLKAIDGRLLDLAVANTNLKALRLLSREGSAALDRLITSIDAMAAASADVAVVRALGKASTSVARIQTLLFVHVPEASAAEMTALEARIRELTASVDTALRDAGPRVPEAASAVADATTAWADYQRITAEVIRLSRLNTNVLSFDVSTHEKSTATDACIAALGEVRAAIQSGPHATR